VLLLLLLLLLLLQNGLRFCILLLGVQHLGNLCLH